jgi:hypothetical protein
LGLSIKKLPENGRKEDSVWEDELSAVYVWKRWLGIGKYFLVQWCLRGIGAVMSSYNIQPSIRMSRTVVEMSHSVLQTAVQVHVQRIEL